MSCPDFEPGTSCTPATGPVEQATELIGDGIVAISWVYMRIYRVTSLSLVSCLLAKVLNEVVFLVVGSVMVKISLYRRIMPNNSEV